MASGALRMAIMPFLYELLGNNTPQSTEQRQHLYNFYTAIMVLAVTAVVFFSVAHQLFYQKPRLFNTSTLCVFICVGLFVFGNKCLYYFCVFLPQKPQTQFVPYVGRY